MVKKCFISSRRVGHINILATHFRGQWKLQHRLNRPEEHINSVSMDAVCTCSHPEYLMSAKHLLANTPPFNSLWLRIQTVRKKGKLAHRFCAQSPSQQIILSVEIFCESWGLSVERWLVNVSSKSLGTTRVVNKGTALEWIFFLPSDIELYI